MAPGEAPTLLFHGDLSDVLRWPVERFALDEDQAAVLRGRLEATEVTLEITAWTTYVLRVNASSPEPRPAWAIGPWTGGVIRDAAGSIELHGSADGHAFVLRAKLCGNDLLLDWHGREIRLRRARVS